MLLVVQHQADPSSATRPRPTERFSGQDRLAGCRQLELRDTGLFDRDQPASIAASTVTTASAGEWGSIARIGPRALGHWDA
jgi:hypothetical protein